MAWDELVRTLGSGGTLIAVLIAAQQLFLNRRQIRANFEDDLSREYRSISRELPVDAFFADADTSVPLTDDELKAMFRYFDLSNEQLRYCDYGQVSPETAAAWGAGIADNLNLPRFEQVWHAITPRALSRHTSRSCTRYGHPLQHGQSVLVRGRRGGPASAQASTPRPIHAVVRPRAAARAPR
jgi:hypothetical protein